MIKYFSHVLWGWVQHKCISIMPINTKDKLLLDDRYLGLIFLLCGPAE